MLLPSSAPLEIQHIQGQRSLDKKGEEAASECRSWPLAPPVLGWHNHGDRGGSVAVFCSTGTGVRVSECNPASSLQAAAEINSADI